MMFHWIVFTISLVKQVRRKKRKNFWVRMMIGGAFDWAEIVNGNLGWIKKNENVVLVESWNFFIRNIVQQNCCISYKTERDYLYWSFSLSWLKREFCFEILWNITPRKSEGNQFCWKSVYWKQTVIKNKDRKQNPHPIKTSK